MGSYPNKPQGGLTSDTLSRSSSKGKRESHEARRALIGSLQGRKSTVERKLQWTRARADHSEVSGPRYGARPGAGTPSAVPASDTWNDRLLVHFLKLGRQADGPQRLAA